MIAVMDEQGRVFRATSVADLVKQLHKASLAPAATDKEWMAQTAARAGEQTGAALADWPPCLFVEALVKVGLLKSVSDRFAERCADKCGGQPCEDKKYCSCQAWADERDGEDK